ncbi:heme biosynthesis HemY N-terminal domain-containing protein [Uliginosibacterium gangwonense]|uniref:heme biosynthesis HemY N-terminal domain-containing protein n=1 Tax=Uliginosibacterium gangwonense TaxID=392736 RepID=UPI00036D4A76|nr:heme biosynthesis HemY N-terminal domain-containing protein [Uliginosibacterium gangwonense]
MKLILWILGLFTLAVGLALLASYNDAYALFVWSPYRVQISINLLALLTVAVFAGLYALTRAVAHTLALPAAVAAFRRERRLTNAAHALCDSARLFYEGRFGQALRQAEKSYPDVAYPGIAALLAARAAHAMHNADTRSRWLNEASKHDKELRYARLMLEAELATADRRYEDAAQILEVLRSHGQRHIATLRLSLQVEQGRGRWDEVARLARQLRKYSALSPDQAAPLIRRAAIEQLREAEGDLPGLQRVWQSLPTADRSDPGFLARAVPYLIGAGDEELAHTVIEETLKENWESDLAALYGRCKSKDLRAQLAAAESWLREHPDDASLLLTLGRLCLRGQLWGKAQSYFEASLSIAPSRSAHLELARLAENLEQTEQANMHYKEAAALGA